MATADAVAQLLSQTAERMLVRCAKRGPMQRWRSVLLASERAKCPAPCAGPTLTACLSREWSLAAGSSSGGDYGPVAEPAFTRTFSAARSALDFEANDSPEAATLSLERHARQRQFPPVSVQMSYRAVAAPVLNEPAAQDDPKLPGVRVRELIEALGYADSKTILDDHLREVRPLFAARPRTFQRTVYRPGALCQFDLW